jgi:hypothetical protein
MYVCTHTHTHTHARARARARKAREVGVKQEYMYNMYIIFQESRITALKYRKSGKAGAKQKQSICLYVHI